MKVTVDHELCDYHGQCTLSAPAVFKLVAPKQLDYDAAPEESQRDIVPDAVDACPMQAISIET